MILMNWDATGTHPPGVALLFGTGLIGNSVASALRRGSATARQRQLDWNWSDLDAAAVSVVETAAIESLAAREGSHLSVIWAAGRSGFGTSVEGMTEEYDAFRNVLDTARRVGAKLHLARRAFVHVSSAGGLFEGQVACDRNSTPRPLRPYAEGKLAQEDLVRADRSLGHRHIVRPSSVYGYVPGARRGLIPVLVAAGTLSRTAKIFGALKTQRDYVFAPDIGRFVARRVVADTGDRDPGEVETALLASGRPATVFEIIHLIETYIGGPLHLEVDPRPDNARDNTFLPSALPADFRPTGLAEGIALTASAVNQHHFLGARL